MKIHTRTDGKSGEVFTVHKTFLKLHSKTVAATEVACEKNNHPKRTNVKWLHTARTV